MKKLMLIFLILVSIGVFMFKFSPFKSKSQVIIDNRSFAVDIADSEKERDKGLAIYEKLPKEKGMLFIFERSDYFSFWMKDMKFAIDIIYINGDRIVDIYVNVPPPKNGNEDIAIVRPKQMADKVFEINANLSKEYNFKIGDKVEIKTP